MAAWQRRRRQLPAATSSSAPDNEKARLKCAAFEPTKNFRDVVKRLIPGDELEVYGSVREGSLNLEKINILSLAEQEELTVPICPRCERNMESAGRGQGYRCRRCKTKSLVANVWSFGTWRGFR